LEKSFHISAVPGLLLRVQDRFNLLPGRRRSERGRRSAPQKYYTEKPEQNSALP